MYSITTYAIVELSNTIKDYKIKTTFGHPSFRYLRLFFLAL